ncbi:MAG: ABC transporter substrate-binding protein [Pseudomonadota bacterium]
MRHAFANGWVLLVCLLAGFISPPALAQQRIISLGGDVTEILYALGAGDRIAATDSTSVFPEAANATPKVGYVRQLSAEGVLSARPDLILISGAAGPEPAVEQIRGTGVPIVEMPATYTIASILTKIERIAAAVDAEEEGAELIAKVQGDWQRARGELARLDDDQKMLFFATLTDGAPRAAGRETAADGVIRLLGGTNVFSGSSGYDGLSAEAAIAANPDVILVMEHHAARVGGLDAVKTHPVIAYTRAGRQGNIIPVDPVSVMQFGPRTPGAVLALARKIKADTASE